MRKENRLVRAMLAWFSRNARDLPWRRTRDPYAVWVSEIMLQQTQVKTVIPYWKHWMRELPDIESLAKAPAERIHKLWEGLGYYSRVRNMQRAARIIVAKHGGTFPENFDAVLALPGIGRYTAGAICSMAFNQARPVLDGNVTRVLARLFGVAGDPREKKTNSRLWRLATELVTHAKAPRPLRHPNSESFASFAPLREADSCSFLNQSLMELGALICTPRQPRCDECPVAGHCVAFRESRVAELPQITRRHSAARRRFLAFAVEKKGRWLVRQRPASVVNAHLWEFPNIEVTSDAANPRRAARLALGAVLKSLEPLCTIRHSITRYRITLEAFRAELDAAPRRLSGRWLTRAHLHRLAFAAAHKKILDGLG